MLYEVITFYGLYPYGEATSDNYTMYFVERDEIENYIGFHVPYLDFTYPEGLRKFYGSALEGYQLDYAYDNMQLNLFFMPAAEKTIDHAEEPVNFTTYEYAYAYFVSLRGPNEVQRAHGKRHEVGRYRITSYNVCYTKLLRS